LSFAANECDACPLMDKRNNVHLVPGNDTDLLEVVPLRLITASYVDFDVCASIRSRFYTSSVSPDTDFYRTDPYRRAN